MSNPIPPGKVICPRCKGRGNVGKRINARSKGQRGERGVIQLLQPVVDTVRSRRCLQPAILQRNALQAHLGGEDIHGLEGFSVEVKFCETLQVDKWWEQCLRQAKRSNAVPVLFYRSSHEDWTIRLRCDVLMPKNDNSIEIDVEMGEDEFLSWFEQAYDSCIVLST